MIDKMRGSPLIHCFLLIGWRRLFPGMVGSEPQASRIKLASNTSSPTSLFTGKAGNGILGWIAFFEKYRRNKVRVSHATSEACKQGPK